MTKSTDATDRRMDYFLECYRTANEELLFRFRHRDHWIKIQLLAQAILFALAIGIELNIAKATTNLPSALILAGPVSVVLAFLYSVEDSIISHIIHYLKTDISEWEMKLSSGAEPMPNLELSLAIEQYESGTIYLKFGAQLVAFVIIPAGLATFWLQLTSLPTTWVIAGVFANVLSWAIILSLLLRILYRRRAAGMKGK